MAVVSRREPWNINIHYDGLLDRAVGADARDVLDVGCGDGFLAARLAARVPHVVALVGFVRAGRRDAAWVASSFVGRHTMNAIHGKWQHTAPIAWPPRDTVASLRAHVRAELPGGAVRRLALGRVHVAWRAPRTRSIRSPRWPDAVGSSHDA